MASTQKTITFSEPLRKWVQEIADKRGIKFPRAVTELLNELRERKEGA